MGDKPTYRTGRTWAIPAAQSTEVEPPKAIDQAALLAAYKAVYRGKLACQHVPYRYYATHCMDGTLEILRADMTGVTRHKAAIWERHLHEQEAKG